jgi:8-oxo-dGTP pyrophosphatase MutT (NUDIX family)
VTALDPATTPARVIVVGILRNERGDYLLCRMPRDRFSEATYPKLFTDGSRRDVHMIFLLFECRAQAGEPRLSAEFDAAEWVPRDALGSYALNRATRATFAKLGLLPPPEPEARPARVAPGRVAPTD